MRLRTMMAAALAAVLTGTGAAQAKDCMKVSGGFSAVRPDTCTSPVQLCTHGTLTGDLTATYDFVADTKSDGPPPTNVTGHSTITLDKSGAILKGEDTSSVAATGAFTTKIQIVGGTRKYEKAGGAIVAEGTLDFAKGTTTGTYSGTICKKGKGEANGVE